MASPTFRLPKKEVDSVVVLNTPLASDVTLALGKLTVLDEAANVGVAVKWSDVLGAKKSAYAAGTANVKTVEFSATTLVANTTYKLTLNFPNTVNFFQGGRETQAVYATRTYVVSVDATPTATELRNAFKAAIENDLLSGVTLTTSNTTNLIFTATSVNAGEILLAVPTGATITNSTPYVAPCGTTSEVTSYVNASLVSTSATYTRYEFLINKAITHNAIPGLRAYKPVRVFVYVNAGAGSGYTAFAAELDSILDGTYATVADFLGTPLLP